MSIRYTHIRTILVMLAVVIACGTANATKYPLTVRDGRGKTISFSKEPVRIISTLPSNTEILFSLGLGSRIVGVGKWDNYPAAANQKPKIGDRYISVEKIISLKPDLVIVHAKLNKDIIPSLERYGIKVVAIDPKTADGVIHDILLIGKITNRETASRTVTGRISAAISLVKRSLAGISRRPRVLVAVQADPLFAAGPHTFVDQLISLGGGTNVAADAKPGFNQFSSEAAVCRRPEIIIGTSKGDKAVFLRGIWKETPAALKAKVYEVNPDIFVRPGPRIADAILAIANLIHPEAFRRHAKR